MKTVQIAFMNHDANPTHTAFDISTDGVGQVMAWYGAYHAGDDYMVMVGGKLVEKDENGELVGELIDA